MITAVNKIISLQMACHLLWKYRPCLLPSTAIMCELPQLEDDRLWTEAREVLNLAGWFLRGPILSPNQGRGLYGVFTPAVSTLQLFKLQLLNLQGWPNIR